MKVLSTLLKKEWLEAWRDKKLIWLPIAMSLLAISQPISLYYMPEILEAAGNLPEGAVIELPVPTGEEVLAGTLSQFGILGTAIFILSVMGTISHERNSGVLPLLMTRPVNALHYIGSKWVANAVILLLSFIISYSLAYYYTNLLFNDVELKRFLLSLAVYSIWILFTMTITLFAGATFKKLGGIVGISIVFIATISVGTSLFPKFMGWSPGNVLNQASEVLMTGTFMESFGMMVIFSIIVIVCLFALTIYQFKRYESY